MTNAQPLPVPVPLMLEAAIGYAGAARFVSFYWMPAGDQAMIDDGQISQDDNWYAFLTFVQHPHVYMALAAYNFGSSDEPASH